MQACEGMQTTLSLRTVPLKSHGPLLSLLPSVTDDCVVCSKDWCYSAAASFARCFDLQTSGQSCTGEAIASKTPAFPQTSLGQQPASQARWQLKILQTCIPHIPLHPKPVTRSCIFVITRVTHSPAYPPL